MTRISVTRIFAKNILRLWKQRVRKSNKRTSGRILREAARCTKISVFFAMNLEFFRFVMTLQFAFGGDRHSSGKRLFSKKYEFSENVQTSFDPRPLFGKIYCNLSGNSWPKLSFLTPKNLKQIFFRSDLISPPSEIFRKLIYCGKKRLPLEKHLMWQGWQWAG